MAEFDRMASVTIQGGAVYGLSLLGQLQAVLDKGYDIVALAGTSAGAIVAALHWAGLSPEDIRKKFEDLVAPGPAGVLGILGGGDMSEAATHIGNARIDRVREAIAPLHPEAGIGEGEDGTERPKIPRYRRLFDWVERARRLRAGAMALPGLYRTARRKGGLFSGATFEALLDAWIRTSPQIVEAFAAVRRNPGDHPDLAGRVAAMEDPNHALTFGDLWSLMVAGTAYFPPLSITATNLSTQELLLIRSTDARFFRVSVAKAIRASGGFPLFFRPVEIDVPDEKPPHTVRRHSFCDGGVMCNFPAFVREFRRDIASDPIYLPYSMRPFVNIGLKLKSEPLPPETLPLRSLGSVLAALFDLATSGTRTFLESKLATETVDRPIVSSQPTTPEKTGWPHTMLEFDKLTPEYVGRMFEKGREFAAVELGGLQFGLPSDEPDDEIVGRMHELLNAALLALGQTDNRKLRLRASLFVPQDEVLALKYRANFDPADPDFDLVLNYYQGLTGYCFVTRRPAICNLERLGKAFREDERSDFFALDPQIRQRIRADRTWLFSVPVFDPERSTPYAPEEVPDPDVLAAAHFSLESPLDGAVFGVLSIDAAMDYAIIPPEPEEQLKTAAVQLIRDALLAASWDIGKVFSSYYGWKKT